MTFPNPIALLNNHDEYNFRDESFEMDNSYNVREDIVRLSLFGVKLLTEGNLMTVVMRPGVGKSSLCEALCAGAVNKEADSFGFEVDLHGRGLLFIDTERTVNDLGRGYKRIIRRAGAYQEKGLMQGDKLWKINAYSYRVLESAEKYVKHLEEHLKKGDFSLVILDQVADFLKSINKEDEAMGFVKKLEYLSAHYKTCFLLTIHPNPMDKTFKPNGWIGSFLLKKSETVMAGWFAENRTSILSTEFEHGKVRNSKGTVETAFKWSEEDNMHMSIRLTENIKDSVKRYAFLDKIIYQVFDLVPNWTAEDLVVVLKEKANKKNKEMITEDFLKTYSAEMGIIQKFGIHYSLTNTDDDSAPF